MNAADVLAERVESQFWPDADDEDKGLARDVAGELVAALLAVSSPCAIVPGPDPDRPEQGATLARLAEVMIRYGPIYRLVPVSAEASKYPASRFTTYSGDVTPDVPLSAEAGDTRVNEVVVVGHDPVTGPIVKAGDTDG